MKQGMPKITRNKRLPLEGQKRRAKKKESEKQKLGNLNAHKKPEIVGPSRTPDFFVLQGENASTTLWSYFKAVTACILSCFPASLSDMGSRIPQQNRGTNQVQQPRGAQAL